MILQRDLHSSSSFFETFNSNLDSNKGVKKKTIVVGEAILQAAGRTDLVETYDQYGVKVPILIASDALGALIIDEVLDDSLFDTLGRSEVQAFQQSEIQLELADAEASFASGNNKYYIERLEELAHEVLSNGVKHLSTRDQAVYYPHIYKVLALQSLGIPTQLILNSVRLFADVITLEHFVKILRNSLQDPDSLSDDLWHTIINYRTLEDVVVSMNETAIRIPLQYKKTPENIAHFITMKELENNAVTDVAFLTNLILNSDRFSAKSAEHLDYHKILEKLGIHDKVYSVNRLLQFITRFTDHFADYFIDLSVGQASLMSTNEYYLSEFFEVVLQDMQTLKLVDDPELTFDIESLITLGTSLRDLHLEILQKTTEGLSAEDYLELNNSPQFKSLRQKCMQASKRILEKIEKGLLAYINENLTDRDPAILDYIKRAIELEFISLYALEINDFEAI